MDSLDLLDFVHNVLTLNHLTLWNQGMTMLSNWRGVFFVRKYPSLISSLVTWGSFWKLDILMFHVFFQSRSVDPSLSLFLFGTHLHWIHKPLGYFGVLDTYVIICHHILTILQILFGIFSYSLCRSNFLDPLKLSKCVLESTDDGTNCPNIPGFMDSIYCSKPM